MEDNSVACSTVISNCPSHEIQLSNRVNSFTEDLLSAVNACSENNLHPSHNINQSVSSLIPDEPLLYLERNTFLTLKEERKLLDPNKDTRKVIELLYHEVSPTPPPPPPQFPLLLLTNKIAEALKAKKNEFNEPKC